jgi:ribosomal-protein-alanine N-acetyltransferase
MRLLRAARVFFGQEKNMKITDFSNDFLDDIIAIEERSFKKPWTKEMFLSSLSNKKLRFKVALEDGKTAGFCLYWTIEGETEILNIAVDPLFRRRSIANNMLEYMEKDAKTENSKAVFLEVRESNAPAVNLYLSFGFQKIGIRKKYYVDEDAIVLRKII